MKQLILLSPLLLALVPVQAIFAGDLEGAAISRPAAEETHTVTLDLTGMT